MPRMTNAKSAPVLNSADEFERKLSWQLFVAEQNALLAYDPSVDEDGNLVWNVGDPIVDAIPSESVYLGDGDYAVTNSSAGAFRPMIELIFYDGVDSAMKSDCEDCDVMWDGNEPCFVCGGPRRDAWSESIGYDLNVFTSEVGTTPWGGLIAVAPYSPSESLRMVGAAMAESFRDVAQAAERAARAMRPVVRRAMENERGERRRLPEQVQGVRADYVLFDEAVSMSMYPTPEQARLRDQTVSYLANAMDIPPEIIASTPSGVPSFHEQVRAINRVYIEPLSGTVDVETVVQNPQNTRRRPRVVPDTNRSYPTSEPNWRRRRPRRA